MLFQNDPFREFDSWLSAVGRRNGVTRPMAMDAYRRDSDVWVQIDLPGVAADAIEIDLDRNVLTVSADRAGDRTSDDQAYFLERPKGRFRRQVHLGDGMDAAGITADYTDGVLTLRIPVEEKAQPRKISVGGRTAIDTESAAA